MIKDPIYYRTKFQELINKAEKDGVKFEYIKHPMYGDCIVFRNLSCRLTIALKPYEREVKE